MSDIRVFISIPIPDREPLRAPSSDLRKVRGVRASPLEQVHITLRFIGDVDESEVDGIAECVSRAAEGVSPFDVSLKGVGAFPNKARPSVVWIGAEPHGTLSLLADRIGRNLKAAGIDFDSKSFKSHVTVGRCRGPAELDGFFAKYGDAEFLSFRCDSVCVMRSVLGPEGAKHTVLHRIDL